MQETCRDCTPDALIVHSGCFKSGQGAFGLTEIIRAGGLSSKMQSQAEGERSSLAKQ